MLQKILVDLEFLIISKIFSENLNWTQQSKIGPITFENIKYKPNPSHVEVNYEKNCGYNIVIVDLFTLYKLPL
jgi:hypothetical protein